MWVRRGATDSWVRTMVRRDYEGLLSVIRGGGATLSVLDAGANAGLAARLFANAFGPLTRVVAVEANHENFLMLRMNSRGLRIEPVHAALWCREDTLITGGGGAGREWAFTVTVPRGDGAGDDRSRATAAGARAVRALTVPALLRAHGLARFDFVKMDVEGAEHAVLAPRAAPGPAGAACAAASASPWLGEVRYIFVETHERFGGVRGARNASIAALRAAGHEVLAVDAHGEPMLLGCNPSRGAMPCATLCRRWLAQEAVSRVARRWRIGCRMAVAGEAV